ncbi:MAG: UDP-N-acetylglucosamine 2-epimerase (non-hydrolyzing) [Anaerolineae bacterium]|nr:UDP-N-acetylglucosamine 2-epimerase (non-hydrolyzing) [Anaerolineae bacterium]MDW8068969.1 UDP-N-acetylglucosamine 2-epimerase (non-hydrolyzing) [Anaerolineae bacterium]
MLAIPLKVALIVGTRPEAIKLAPVALLMRQMPEAFHPVLIATAQHREMLDQVLTLFDLQPDYDLNIMRPDQSPFEVTAGILTRLRSILQAEGPDLVMVQGDTNSAFAGALAAFYHRIPVAHVEAGLRTYDKYQPFPEEINRRLVSVLADWHFAPTDRARKNLLREGTPPERIFVTGNTVVDALQMILSHPSPPLPAFVTQLAPEQRLLLVTAHRRENWGQPLRRICAALRILAQRFPEVSLAFSVHPNPNVQNTVRQELRDVPRIHLLEPVPYPAFVHLMARSYLILTDSGGIQEEAPSLGKPVLVLREVTERPEGVEAGVLKVVGTDVDRIVSEAACLLTDEMAYREMAQQRNPYGDGRAAARIVEILKRS